MDKKDIYEHLAKIYLDASLKRKKKTKDYPKVFSHPIFISIVFISGLAAFLVTNLNGNKSLNSEGVLVLSPDVLKINSNFGPIKKEIYSLALNKLDCTPYTALGFSVKKADHKDNISLRVKFISRSKEKSEMYFKNIPYKWQNYKVNLSEFKDISDWSSMLNLSFIIEEWDIKEKTGAVYIDSVRFLR